MHAHVLQLLPAAPTSVDHGLSLHQIVESLPSDPASLFALFVFAASVALVVWAGRGKKGGGGAAT